MTTTVRRVGAVIVFVTMGPVLALAAVPTPASASVPAPTWERTLNPDRVYDAVGDADGSVVIAAGGLPPTTILRAFDAKGDVAWEAPVATSSSFGDLQVARFGDGSVLVGGTALTGNQQITFDPAGAAVTLTGAFVARYQADGTFVWVHPVTTDGIRGAYYDRVLQALTLPDGGVRLAFEIAKGHATFDALDGPHAATVTGAGAFAVDYEPDGSIAALVAAPVWIDARFLYSVAIGRTGDGDITLLAFDVDGSTSYVAARVRPDGTIVAERDFVRRDPDEPFSAAAAGADGSLYAAVASDAFCPAEVATPRAYGLAKLDPDLSLTWLRAGVTARGLRAEADGSVVVAGATTWTHTFGNGPDAPTIDPVSFVAHVDATGRVTELAGHPTNWYALGVLAGAQGYGIGTGSQPPSTAAIVDQFDRAAMALATPGPSGRGCPGDPVEPVAPAAAVNAAAVPAAAPVAAAPSFTG